MTLALGDAAPSFSLKGVDGKVHSLEDYADAAVLVLVQSCVHCPYVQASEEHLKETQAVYAASGVRIVAINSNSAELQPEDSFDEMVAHAKAQHFNFEFLHDETQAVARALNGTRTPEVFVFDRERRLRYHGAPLSALLDHRSATDGDGSDSEVRSYLREALDAVLAGQAPATTETPLLGCSVKSDDLILLRDPIRFEWQ